MTTQIEKFPNPQDLDAVKLYCVETLQRLRDHIWPSDEDAWRLGSVPFVDELRKLVRSDDVPWLRELLRSETPSQRRLAVILGRLFADEEMQREVSMRWEEEPHLNTKLSMIFFLAYYPLLDWKKVLAFLERERERAIPLILSYYEKHPNGPVCAIVERLEKPAYEGSRPMYLFTLAELVRKGTVLPEVTGRLLEQLEQDGDLVVAPLAGRVREALCKPSASPVASEDFGSC